MPELPSHAATASAVEHTGPPAFTCSSNVSGKHAAWIRATGELDLATSPQLERVVDDALTRARLVVLDLHEVEFVDTSGVHLVVAASARARAAASRLLVLRGPRRIRDTFDLTGMDDAIDSHRGGSAA
jgi:anti-sigma B factor antagonist